ncbi:MAG: nuclear transport factor 2 family protein [Caulobacteraceae bacterium]|nr:nuclear transport factor 2 family protein [Caulobacteraceae bacterium]
MADDLQALLDEREIIGVALRYARCMDARDHEGFLSCFTEDAAFGFPGRQVRGHRKIGLSVDAGARVFSDGTHQTTNFAVTIDGDRAEMHSYYVATQVVREPVRSPLFVMAGVYDDVLVRTQQGWKISSRQLTNRWIQGDPEIVAALGLSEVL